MSGQYRSQRFEGSKEDEDTDSKIWREVAVTALKLQTQYDLTEEKNKRILTEKKSKKMTLLLYFFVGNK